MELFRGVNVDWLGKKWYFLGFSLIFSVAGIIAMSLHWAHTGTPVPLGVDFRGGTEVQVQFKQTPDINAIRQAVAQAGIKDASVVNYNDASLNEVLISLPEQQDETSLDAGRAQIVNALHSNYANTHCSLPAPRWMWLGRRSASSWRNRRCWQLFIRCWGCWFTCGFVFS